jgi:hypothetical protein
MDANVSRGQLKNLVTDRPSPITVKLAQKSDKDSVFKLMDANVTRGQMKNLITDRPSPITVKLAQKKGVPVFVDPILIRPTGAESEKLGLDLKVGPDEIEVQKRKAKEAAATQQLSQKNGKAAKNGVPVLVDPILMKPTGAENMSLGMNMVIGPTEVSIQKKDVATKNTLTQKGGVPVLVDPVLIPKTGAENMTLGLNMRIGPDEVSVQKKPANKNLLQLEARNPVHNPPYNNWSVNQPAVDHDAGWAAGADFQQDIIVDGHHVHY